MLNKLSASMVASTLSTIKMIFTLKIVILASLASATEKENGYYVTVENVSMRFFRTWCTWVQFSKTPS